MENLATLLNKEYEALGYRTISYNSSGILLVSLHDHIFKHAKPIKDHKKLDGLAKVTFGGGYKKINQVAGNLWHIDFTKPPRKSSTSFHGYGLRVGIPASYPEVMIQRNINTASSINLNDDQRELYMEFINGVYQIFIENAKEK